jgi:nanoRNase/pAp phosphatase (c-di-AMP/oligoRNAs hydrolase)
MEAAARARLVLVAVDDFLWELLPPAALSGVRTLYVVETAAARARIARAGGEVVSGRLESEAVYRRALGAARTPIVVAVPAGREAGVLGAIRRVNPSAPVVALAARGHVRRRADITALPLAAIAEDVVVPALAREAARARVDLIRRRFAGARRVLVMLQDDPDPDAIASALALVVLLNRTRSGATIATFGRVMRAENRAMLRVLDIDVERIVPQAVRNYDRVAMVDVQPRFFEERVFGEVDLVIDHHPQEHEVRAALKDVRPAYGATASIMTEYLRAAEVKITSRLATALLYAIRTDTQDLERDATHADVAAFAFLHGLANHRALRQIERPELGDAGLDLFADGIRRRRVVDGVVFSHLGRIPYPELAAQFADLLLQLQGSDWAVVSGTVNGELHVSVRNTGYVSAAGELVRRAFGDLGSAGGHRAMAKAVVRLADWRGLVGRVSADALASGIVARVRRALKS